MIFIILIVVLKVETILFIFKRRLENINIP